MKEYSEVFNPDTKEWVAPQYTVGQGWPGSYCNDHFATLEQAQAYFDGYVAKIMAQKTKKGAPLWKLIEKPAPYKNAWVCRYEFNHANTGKRHGTVQIISLTEKPDYSKA